MENQCNRECNQGQKTNNIVDLSQESALEIFHRSWKVPSTTL